MIEKFLKRLWLIEREEQIEARELTVEEKIKLRKMFPEIGEKNENNKKNIKKLYVKG